MMGHQEFGDGPARITYEMTISSQDGQPTGLVQRNRQRPRTGGVQWEGWWILRIGESEVLQNWRCKFMLLENDRRAEIGEVGGRLTVEVAKLEALISKRV